MGAADSLDVADLTRMQQERDLYLRLLDLGQQTALEPFLREALALIVEVSHARQGYIELYDDESGAETPKWWIAHGLSDAELASVRAAVSRGIIAEALATGETIVTPSAQLDPRFSGRESVRLARIEAVLCAPVGDDPPRGVLYLQGPAHSDMFSDEGRVRAARFVRHLAPFVDRLLAQRHGQERLDPTLPLRGSLQLTGIVGHSAALAGALRQVALAAPLDVNVLLTGESGTGKSQLARAIHDNGPRAGRPFIEVNSGALPDTLVESELFGALAGAHSTATRRIEGKVAAAEGGTLFLDEVGDLSLAAQSKLLQLLQSRLYYPLGSSKPMQADVRVIAATNHDLKQLVVEKRFRDDLFYRLQVLPIRVPSLAERREDIVELATVFCANACARHGFPPTALSRNALRAAEIAAWPGNVRELANAIEAAVIRAAGEGAVQVERTHLFPDDQNGEAGLARRRTLQSATREFQRRLLGDVLAATGWNIPETARRLDITRSHVYNLIRALGIEREPERET